jgi:hypothetical protein
MAAEVTASSLVPIAFVELEFDSGTLRLWSGIGDITWDSKTWSGIGSMGAVNAPDETTEIRATSFDLVLSGVPSSNLSLVIGEQYQGRAARLWIGALSSSGAVIADPVLFEGVMDACTVMESGETATITVSVETELVDLRRPRERRYTHEDQIQLYPGDLGLEYIAGLQDKEIIWGKRSLGTGGYGGGGGGGVPPPGNEYIWEP